MKRIARAAALTLIAVVALSGCIRYNVDMTLSEDNTASGTVVIAVQKGIGEQMGVATDEEALTQVFGESPFGPGFTPAPYADGDWVGQSYAFDAMPITDLTDLASLFTVTREGDLFTVVGDQAPVAEDEMSEMPEGAESALSITFPGEVIESNGTVEGTTVTWDLVAMTEPIQATAKATGSGSGSDLRTSLLIGGGIALVVLVGAAVAVVLLRRRGSATPVHPAPLDAVAETAPEAAPATTDAPAPAATVAPAAATVPPATVPPATAPKQRTPRAPKPKTEPLADDNGAS